MGDARSGRRSNGLEAAAYAAAGDVDPRVGEHLLDVLALEGIAAYLRPSSDQHPVTWSTTLPKRPTDRLYVDREHLETAKELVERLAREEREAGEQAASRGGWREPTSDEVDQAFAQIVAGFGRTATPTTPLPTTPLPTTPLPTATSSPTAATPTPPTPAPPTAPPPAPPQTVEPVPTAGPARDEGEPSLLDALDSFGANLPDDEDDRFVPPEPPPVPRPSLATALAVVGVVGGLAVFLKPDLISFLPEGLSMFFGFAAVITGFGTLVWRLRPGGDDDDIDPDNGARV